MYMTYFASHHNGEWHSMTIRGLIFDLDGTLIDSLKDITSALNHALERHGLPRASARQTRRWIGDGLPTLVRRAAPDVDENTLDSLVQLAKSYYAAHPVRKTAVYPNILRILDLLQSRHVPMCVLSNKPHVLTTQIVDALGLAKFFVDVRGCQKDEERKPSPIVALEMARRVNLPPDEIGFIGDSPVDVSTARNAGMIAIAVTWGFRDRTELAAMEPDFLLKSAAELCVLLDEKT